MKSLSIKHLEFSPPTYPHLPPRYVSQPGQESLILSSFISSLWLWAPIFTNDLRSFCSRCFSKIGIGNREHT